MRKVEADEVGRTDWVTLRRTLGGREYFMGLEQRSRSETRIQGGTVWQCPRAGLGWRENHAGSEAALVGGIDVGEREKEESKKILRFEAW